MLKSTAQTKKSSVGDNTANVEWVTGVVSKIQIINKKFGYCLIQPDDGSGVVLLHKKTLDEHRFGFILAINQRLRFKSVALKEVEIPGVNRFADKLKLLWPRSKQPKQVNQYSDMIRVSVSSYNNEKGFGYFQDITGNKYIFRLAHLQRSKIHIKNVCVEKVFYIKCSVPKSSNKLGPQIDTIKE